MIIFIFIYVFIHILYKKKKNNSKKHRQTLQMQHAPIIVCQRLKFVFL